MSSEYIVEEINIPVPWGHVSGKWWGPRNQQPIIAIHGWQDNAGTFDKLIPLLPSHTSVLCIDLPGHGLSSHYPKGSYYYIFWDGLCLVRRIVKYFKWNKITILGHSLGGAIGFLYAATFPDDIEKLISIDIVSPAVRNIAKSVEDTGPSIDKFLKYESLSEDDMPCYSYDEMINLVFDAYNGSLTRESSEILMKRGMAPVPKTKKHNNDGFLFCRDVRLKVSLMGYFSLDLVLEYASKIKCEVLNIRGKPGMKFDKIENYFLVLEKMKENAKKLEFYEVEGTHHLHLNTPENIAPYIINFLISQENNDAVII